jgi:hypothetical protein
MPLITRQDKGSKLTIQDLDNNLIYLENLALNATASQGATGPQGPAGTGSTCDLILCGDNITISGFVDVDGIINNLFSDQQSYFTQSLVRGNVFGSTVSFGGNFWGNYSYQTQSFMGVDFINEVGNGMIQPPEELTGGLKLPCKIYYLNETEGGAIQEEYKIDVPFIELAYTFQKEPPGSTGPLATNDYSHFVNFKLPFEGFEGILSINVETDLSDTSIVSFTFSVFEPVYATAS